MSVHWLPGSIFQAFQGYGETMLHYNQQERLAGRIAIAWVP